MSDSKVFMFPENAGNNNFALGAALANNQMNPLAMMGMMNGGMGGMNGMWNNPIWAIVFLAALQNGGLFGGRNGNGALDIEIQSLISAIREQLSTNQNTLLLMDAVKGNSNAVSNLATSLNCDFNAVQGAIQAVQLAICTVGSRGDMNAMLTINAINSGDAALASQLAECCCTIREGVTRLGYENQIATLNQTNVLTNAINTVATGQERGFSSVAYETQRQTCDIENAIKDSTSRILDGLRAAEMREMQNKIDALRELNSLKDVVINNGQLTAIFSLMILSATAPIATAVNNLQSDVNGIKCKLPETVSVPYPQLTAIPSCAANVLGAYGLFNGFGTFGNWNNNSLWG